MYRKMESAQQRSAEIGQLAYQLDALEKVFGPEGPFVCGAEITAADGALFPTFAFITLMLPKYFGWADVFAGRPKLKAWWEAVQRDAVAKRVSACPPALSAEADKLPMLIAPCGTQQQAWPAWAAAIKAHLPLLLAAHQLDFVNGPPPFAPALTPALPHAHHTLALPTAACATATSTVAAAPCHRSAAALCCCSLPPLCCCRALTCGQVLDEVNGGLAAWEKADRWKEMGILDHVKDTNYKWAH